MEPGLDFHTQVLCCVVCISLTSQNGVRFSKFQIHPGQSGVVQCFLCVLYIFGDSRENTNHGSVDVFLVVF